MDESVWKYITSIQHELMKLLEELSRLRCILEHQQEIINDLAADPENSSDGEE